MDFETRFGNKIAQCERAIAYSFSEKALCAEASNAAADRMASFTNGDRICNLPKNDRLAIYGDSVAASILCRRWYRRGYDKGAGRIHSDNLCTTPYV
jgi:ribonuclease-3